MVSGCMVTAHECIDSRKPPIDRRVGNLEMVKDMSSNMLDILGGNLLADPFLDTFRSIPPKNKKSCQAVYHIGSLT